LENRFMPYTPRRCDPTADSTPTADPGVGLIIEFVDTDDLPDGQPLLPFIGIPSAASRNHRVYHDRAARAFHRDRAVLLAQSILDLIHATPIEDQPEFLENFLRDELFDIARQIAGEREIFIDAHARRRFA
jgi:hypothetical protein